jgi:Dynamin family
MSIHGEEGWKLSISPTNSADDPARWWAAKCLAIRDVCEAVEDAAAAMDRAVADAGGMLRHAGAPPDHAWFAARIDHLLEDQTEILITGMVGRGKSLVATALLDGEIWTKSSAEPLTARVTRAVWGERRGAAVLRADGLEQVTVGRALDLATQLSDDFDVTEVIHYMPHKLLRLGVQVIDSAGLGDPGEVSYDDLVQKEIAKAHVIIVVLMSPPNPVVHERRLIENVGANASRTIVVANLSGGLFDDPDEAEDKAGFIDTIRSMVAAGARKAGIGAEEIPVVVMDAKRAAKAQVGDPRGTGGRDDLQRAVYGVIEREVWQDRLAQAAVLAAEARHAGIERGRALLARATESLDVGRELAWLRDREVAIARNADAWNENLLATGDKLADQAGSIWARPARDLSRKLASGYLPAKSELAELGQRYTREAQADLYLLEKKYRSQLEHHLDIKLLLPDGPKIDELDLGPPGALVPVSAGIVAAVLEHLHPLLALVAGAIAVKKLGALAAPTEQKIAALQAQLAQAEDRAVKAGAAWAAQVTATASEALRAITAEQVAELARRRQDITSPINPDLAKAFKTAIEDIVSSLDSLDIEG